MTGPEHFKAAEEILGDAKDADADLDDVALYLEFAKVHAALAQTAATAEAGGLTDTYNTAQWERVINGGVR